MLDVEYFEPDEFSFMGFAKILREEASLAPPEMTEENFPGLTSTVVRVAVQQINQDKVQQNDAPPEMTEENFPALKSTRVRDEEQHNNQDEVQVENLDEGNKINKMSRRRRRAQLKAQRQQQQEEAEFGQVGEDGQVKTTGLTNISPCVKKECGSLTTATEVQECLPPMETAILGITERRSFERTGEIVIKNEHVR